MAGDPRLGPLTTTFTPLPGCTTLFVSPDQPYYLYQGQTCTDSETFVDDPQCWPTPETLRSRSIAAENLSGRGFYSPGLVCPAGFTSACRLTGTYHQAFPTATESSTWRTAFDPNFQFQFGLLPEETAVGCCPRCVSTVLPFVTTIFVCYV